MKLILFLMLILNTCYAGDVEIFKKIKENTVLVIMNEIPLVMNSGTGSGIVIDSFTFNTVEMNIILTNHHVCVLPHKGISIQTSNKEVYPSDVLFTDKKSDVCFLFTKKFKDVEISIKPKEFESGSTVYSYNFGLVTNTEGTGTYTKGILGERSETKQYFFGKINPGASGSGLFNENLELIGLINSYIEESNISMAIRVEIVDTLLKMIKEKIEHEK